ncbi:high mobility group B protein 9-like [Canna indica]|uniref:High mobility group B protein 9-like n=1 Tax=Canna indica TaxID=4628 RepID=A0AAQ3QCM1_9LILI|nr:high mobility group B protein 9-like [Canna indica]
MMELSGDVDVDVGERASEKRKMELSGDVDVGGKASESEKRNMELGDNAGEKASEKMKEVMEDDCVKDSGPGADFRPYPKPLAKYEDVIADPELLKETLMRLHAEMGTKFMVPIIGGKGLDLHRLFVEVTSRGGLEKVIAERKWREVTASFSFPSTATNASFVLRKYYLSLLQHYEQIYFFGSQGWNPSNATSSPSGRSVESPRYRETQAALQKRRKNCGGPSVVGVIDGKFDCGYFVTVAVGSEKLKGVLYHIPEQMEGQALISSPDADNSNLGRPSRRQRQEELSMLDPNHPKPNSSEYNLLFAEQQEREMETYKESLRTGQLVLSPSQGHQLPGKQVMEESDTKFKKVDDNTIFFNEAFPGSDCDSDGPSSSEHSEIERSSTVGKVTSGSACLAEPSKEGEGLGLGKREDEKMDRL